MADQRKQSTMLETLCTTFCVLRLLIFGHWVPGGARFKSKHSVVFSSSTFFSSSTSCCSSPSPMARWRLMCPPRAWPIVNLSPQIGHPCTRGFVGPTRTSLQWSANILGFLWLARCPPSAWKDGNCLLQVLHPNILFDDDDVCICCVVGRSKILKLSLLLLLLLLLLWWLLLLLLMGMTVLRLYGPSCEIDMRTWARLMSTSISSLLNLNLFIIHFTRRCMCRR